MLGGLRGPLVMMLWTSSETQKQDKNLEDFDTKVELIRLLQPEFDSVLLFQIWNKAYNISVQMSSLPNKYATILEALDYGRSVEAERPDSINILASMGEIYFNKLGQSNERQYYLQRIREDTRHRPQSGPRQGGQGWQRTRHEVTDGNHSGRLLSSHSAAAQSPGESIDSDSDASITSGRQSSP